MFTNNNGVGSTNGIIDSQNAFSSAVNEESRVNFTL